MSTGESSSYRYVRRERRCKNRRTDTTRTRLRRVILTRSRSRFRSSSLVTRYCAIPWIAASCPGGPEGFRKPETQTLVSSRATSGTACCFDLSAGLTDFGFDLFLSYSARSSTHLAHKAFKVVAPFAFRTQGNGHTRFFFQTKRLKRPKYAFFEDCLKSSFHRWFSLLNSHGGL